MKNTIAFSGAILYALLIFTSCEPSPAELAKQEAVRASEIKDSLNQVKKDSIAQVKLTKKNNITYVKNLFKKDNQASLERTTASKLDITDISSLTNATGWIQAEDGDEWISAKNKIPEPSGRSYDAYSLGHYSRNFISYKFKKLVIKGEELIIFSDYRKSGYYTYQNIREGWNNSTECFVVIFKPSELEKFKNLANGKTTEIRIQALATVLGYLDTEDYTLKNIGQLIRKGTLVDYNQEYSFKILPIKEKDISRFLFTEIEDYGINKSEIGKYYFETSYDAFNKFITF